MGLDHTGTRVRRVLAAAALALACGAAGGCGLIPGGGGAAPAAAPAGSAPAGDAGQAAGVDPGPCPDVLTAEQVAEDLGVKVSDTEPDNSVTTQDPDGCYFALPDDGELSVTLQQASGSTIELPLGEAEEEGGPKKIEGLGDDALYSPSPNGNNALLLVQADGVGISIDLQSAYGAERGEGVLGDEMEAKLTTLARRVVDQL